MFDLTSCAPQVGHYEKHLTEAQSVNKEIAGTLEAVMQSHSQLQAIVENLQVGGCGCVCVGVFVCLCLCLCVCV